jgi:hypothetical protein
LGTLGGGFIAETFPKTMFDETSAAELKPR